ncbi:telomeric repeat-binding factor 2-interacting protein 1-like [Clytia hemisphaerica]|uniref:Telomeric repeat-binding factor 2-interacting protein 1 n=1 Tax=Clytia hemisphaerica TaxID=252671 RepID=A0A7M5WWE2_9CNID
MSDKTVNKLFDGLVFRMQPGPNKAMIKKLILDNGGRFCRAGEKVEHINLTDVKNGQSGIHTDFIQLSIERKTLQHIETYDLSRPANSSSKMKVDKNLFGKARQAYTKEEDEAIIEYVTSHQTEYGSDGSTGGNLIWKQMEEKKITSHTWQSMKSRFHSHLEHRVTHRPTIITRSSGNSTVAYAVSRDSPIDLVKAPPPLKPKKKFEEQTKKRTLKKLYSSSSVDPFDQSPRNSIDGKSIGGSSSNKSDGDGETKELEKAIKEEPSSQENLLLDEDATQSLSEDDDDDDNDNDSIIYSPSNTLQPILTSTCDKENSQSTNENESQSQISQPSNSQSQNSQSCNSQSQNSQSQINQSNIVYPFPEDEDDENSFDDFDQQLVAAANGSQTSQSSSTSRLRCSQSENSQTENEIDIENLQNTSGKEAVQSQNNEVDLSPVVKKAKKKKKKRKQKKLLSPEEPHEFNIKPCTCAKQADYNEAYELMNYFDNLPEDFNWKAVREKMGL